MVKFPQEIVETGVPVQRIQFRVDPYPQQFRVFKFVGALQQIERRFKSTQCTMDQREMIRRDIASFGKLVHFLEHGFSLGNVTAARLGSA